MFTLFLDYVYFYPAPRIKATAFTIIAKRMGVVSDVFQDTIEEAV